MPRHEAGRLTYPRGEWYATQNFKELDGVTYTEKILGKLGYVLS